MSSDSRLFSVPRYREGKRVREYIARWRSGEHSWQIRKALVDIYRKWKKGVRFLRAETANYIEDHVLSKKFINTDRMTSNYYKAKKRILKHFMLSSDLLLYKNE